MNAPTITQRNAIRWAGGAWHGLYRRWGFCV